MFNFSRFNTFLYNRASGKLYRFHPILTAEYTIEAPDLNHAFVVGQDIANNLVSGSAVTSADVALVGERLEVTHDPAVTTGVDAALVAASLLAKARLDGQKGRITITPHCGLELWDVLNISDAGANQGTTYRAIGYTLDYDTRLGKYQHTVTLSAP